MPDIYGVNVGGTEFDIDDPNDVEKEAGELAETVINYESATTPTIGSFTAFLNQFVSGTKVGQWFKNFRAGCDFILHIGSIVNNCVTDNEALPLSAAQGKVLMDELTQVKSDLSELDSDISLITTNFPDNGRIKFLTFDSSKDLLTQVDSLATDCVYTGYGRGSQNSNALGLPTSNGYFLLVFNEASGYKSIFAFGSEYTRLYLKNKRDSTWSGWYYVGLTAL